MRPQVQWSAPILACLLAMPALGQAPNILDRLQQGVDTPLLLAAPSIRKELKLTDEQNQKIHKIVKESHDKYPRQPIKATQDARDRVNKALPDILSAEQVKRLKQIKLQIDGVAAFTKPDVQQKLKLTDKQKEEMQTLSDDLKNDVRKTIQSAANLREKLESVRKVPALRKEAVQKAVAKLNDEQKKTWNEMTGDKFDFSSDVLRGGGLLPDARSR